MLTLKKNLEKIVLINWKTFYFCPLAPPLLHLLYSLLLLFTKTKTIKIDFRN